MKKLLFDAKLEHECLRNYKHLQALFQKKNILKVHPLSTLSLPLGHCALTD